jgi:hypothetical protein
MSKRLKGNSSLDINQVPRKNNESLGLIEPKHKSEMRTFRLSYHAIKSIEKLSKRFSEESRIKISMAKIIELSIFNAETKTLEELLQVEK